MQQIKKLLVILVPVALICASSTLFLRAPAGDSSISSTSSDMPVVLDDAAADEDNSGADTSGAVDDVASAYSAEVSHIEYIYVDSSVAAVEEEQYILLGFTGLNDAIASSEIDLEDEQGQTRTITAEKVDDEAALFSVTFEEGEEHSYQLVTVRYALESAYTISSVDLTAAGKNEDEYRFEVVSQTTAEVLEQSANNEGVTAMVITEDGELIAADSIEQAIEVAAASEDTGSELTMESTSISSISSAPEDYLIVAIDAGHGGSDPGAVGYLKNYGTNERDVNLSIAKYFQSELATYTGVTPYLTRSDSSDISLEGRVQKAVTVGADVFVSVHCNSASSSSAYGAEVYYPNNSSYNSPLHTEGKALAEKIQAQLVALGLGNRGTKTRDYPQDSSSSDKEYANGSVADYYSVIRNARKNGITGIIVEHAFVSNASDAAKLASSSFQKQLGVADATGIAQQYGLIKDSVAKSSALVALKAHVASLGWEGTVYDGKTSGTTGKSKNLEAFTLSLMNTAASVGGSIQYRALVDGTWQDWVFDGATAGTTGQSKAIEAVQIKLTGTAAETYDVYYRVHSAKIGWLGWASNGASAGTKDYGYNAQALEVVIVSKDSSAPGETTGAFQSKVTYTASFNSNGGSSVSSQVVGEGDVLTKPGDPTRTNYDFAGWYTDDALTVAYDFSSAVTSNLILYAKWTEVKARVSYTAHSQSYGWMSTVTDGATAGTTNEAKRLEALKVTVGGTDIDGSVEVRAHVASIGWQDWVSAGALAGTTNQSKAIEAVAIRLTGNAAASYDIYYRVHSQSFGWSGWAKNGACAGSQGYGKRAEAIEIKLVKAGESAPGSTENAFQQVLLSGTAHVQSTGWTSTVQASAVDQAITLGTTGESLRVEALELSVANGYDGGSISYSVHVQNKGWMSDVSNGALAGTTGQALRIEAIKISLSGAIAEKYDIYYRVHAQSFGWLGWAKNGEEAGTKGYSFRAEAIEIMLVTKGGTAPGSTSEAFKEQIASATSSSSAIMGTSLYTAAQMAARFNRTGHSYPASTYKDKGASTITEFCELVVKAATAEGVRAEVVFAQAMHETGWLQFGGSVQASQCNFGGLGATGGGVSGATFADVYTGLLAQTQHLKAYASTAALNYTCVDPRFKYVTRGCAPNLEDLNGRWAVPGTNYGQNILAIIESI